MGRNASQIIKYITMTSGEKHYLFVPKNYDKNKTYLLVMFIHDTRAISADTKTL
jgi:hypothetical protein